MRKELARDIRTTFRAPNRKEADRYLKIAIDKYRETAPIPLEWMEKNIAEGLAVFQFPMRFNDFFDLQHGGKTDERDQTENSGGDGHSK